MSDTEILDLIIAEFPGLVADEEVNGADLVELLSSLLTNRK